MHAEAPGTDERAEAHVADDILSSKVVVCLLGVCLTLKFSVQFNRSSNYRQQPRENGDIRTAQYVLRQE